MIVGLVVIVALTVGVGIGWTLRDRDPVRRAEAAVRHAAPSAPVNVDASRTSGRRSNRGRIVRLQQPTSLVLVNKYGELVNTNLDPRPPGVDQYGELEDR